MESDGVRRSRKESYRVNIVESDGVRRSPAESYRDSPTGVIPSQSCRVRRSPKELNRNRVIQEVSHAESSGVMQSQSCRVRRNQKESNRVI